MATFKVPVKKLYAILVTHNKETNQSTIDYELKSVFGWQDNKTVKKIVKLQYTPHQRLLRNPNDKSYDNYMIKGGKYVGYGIEHSPEVFRKLIKEFKGYPFENKFIRCKIINKRICITDGLHRANILLFKGVEKIPIFLENTNAVKKHLKVKKEMKLKEQMRAKTANLRKQVNQKIKPMNTHLNLSKYEDELLQLLRGTVEKTQYNAWRNSGKLQSGYHSYNTFGLDLQGQRNCSIRINNIMKHYSFKNKTVLDVGCNTGGMTFHIPEIKHGYGFDYDKNCIAFAKKLGELVDKNKYTFNVFDFDKRDLADINKIITRKVDTIILCSLGSWVKKWRDLYQLCYDLKGDIIFETNNDEEGIPQLEFFKERNMNIKLIIDNSKDDITGNNRRKTYLLSH